MPWPVSAILRCTKRPGRSRDDEITLFESHGMALQDIYTGRHVLDTARERGIGIDLPIGD